MRIIQRVLTRIDAYLLVPGLDSEMLLRKRWAWIWLMVTFIGSGLSTAIFLFVLKLWPLWWFGLSMMLGYAIAIPVYRRSSRFDLVINVLFAFIIVITCIVMIQVGGLHSNLGFIFIGVNCALGSVLAGNLRWTMALFALYCASILLIGTLQPSLETPAYITEGISTGTFVALALWINACILLLMIFFMKDHERFEQLDAKRLKDLDEAKTRLYNSVSHEFRTPLTLIKGVAELIEKEPRKWASRGPARIKHQTEILLRLVNQMLDISRLQANRMPLNLTHGDLNEYACYIASSFFGLAENKGIQLSIKPNKTQILTGYDQDKVMKILSNLMSNALKYTHRNGHIEFCVTLDAKVNVARVIVADDGKGIPEEAIAHIFDQFYQVPDDSNHAAGTGLGLTLAYELVKLMHGNIDVESELGKGSKFTVTLPVMDIPEGIQRHELEETSSQPELMPHSAHAACNGAPEAISGSISPDKPILLIVEDNADVRKYLEEILTGKYTMEFARNGEEGVHKALEMIPDIILSDVMMPVMDGFQMIQQLRNDVRTDHIPIVVLTARGDQDSRIEGLDEGADHYLVKPIDVDELQLTLDNIIKARERLQYKLGTICQPVNQTATYRRSIDFLAKVNVILDDHLGDPDLDISAIYDALHMSRAQFYRKFNALTNTSIGKYIRSYRLHRAKEILETTSKNVTETALDTGFRNVSHFSTAFKQEFGRSPGELIV